MMRKSETGIALPAIKTYNKASSFGLNKQRMRSVFVEKVKNEVGEDNQYQGMETSRLGQQHKKLKQILRSFNDQSHFILSNFIEAQPRVTKTHFLRNSADQLKVKKQETINKEKIIQQCEQQLKALQSRCDNLKYITREEMEKQIIATRHQIQSLRAQNKESGRTITLNGLNICKGEKFNLIKEMEYEKLQLEAKKTQLTANNSQIAKQNEQIKQNIIVAEKQQLASQNDYKQALSQEMALAKLEKNKELMKDRKKHLESIAQRNQQYSSGLKQRYYTKLRQLDQIVKATNKTNQQLARRQEDFQKGKKQLIILEHQFSAIKQGVVTIKLLDNRNKK